MKNLKTDGSAKTRKWLKKGLSLLLLVLIPVMLLEFTALGGGDSEPFALYENEFAIREGRGGVSKLLTMNSIRNNRLSSRSQRVTGIFDVWYCNALSAREITFTGVLNASSGRAKLVFVPEEGELVTLAESAGTEVTLAETLSASGLAEIRLVCDGAAYTLELEASDGQLTIP